MKSIIELIQSLIEGFDKRGRLIAFLGLAIFLAVGLYWVESVTHILFYHHLSTRLSLLQELNSLAQESVVDRPELVGLYDQLVKELTSVRNKSFSISLPNPATNATTQTWKAISSAFLWLLLIPIALFSKFKTRRDKLSVLVVLIVAALVTSAIGWYIPTLTSPWVNYLVLPAIQIIAIVRLALK